MSINQISTANTFGQLVTAVSAVIAVANNFTDGPQSQTNSTWTFTNANVGVNVTGTLLATQANVSIFNTSQANVTNETVGRSNVSTANITVANVVGATVTNLNTTNYSTANANISVLLQVSDRANIYSANIQFANIGTVSITTLSVSELTVPVLNASFANITTLSVTGTSQHNALISTLLTSTNANVGILNASTANISNLTAPTINASFANLTTATIGTSSITTETVGTITSSILNSSFANLTSANIVAVNIGTANIVQMTSTTITTLNVSSLNVTAITTNPTISANPTANLQIATKNYADTGAGGNVVWKATFSAKGDLPVGNGVNSFSNLVSGSNGQSLVVDTQTSTGLRWATRGALQTFRGLSMGTSSADKIANGNQVIMHHVEEIVMDDGEVVSSWTDRSVIDITASGVGGIDTGSVLANTWYEIYAIRKRSDGTKNFILHRALDRNVDQNTTNTVVFAYNTTVQVNRVTSPNVRVAQSFVANIAGPLTSLEIQVFRTATATGNMWLTLHSNTAGDPGASALATSRKYDCARAQTAHMNVRFVFDGTANVVQGNSYFWVYNVDQTASDANFMTLQGSSTVYANGVVKGNNGASWVALAPGVGTLAFKTYQEANSTSLTFPAGYDQKCLIGYAATDQASKLREFRQRNRTINTFFSPQWMGFATRQATQPEVADLTTVVPPIHCDVEFMAFNVTGGISFHAIGSLDALDMPGTGADTQVRGYLFGHSASLGSLAAAAFPPLWVEQQAMVVHAGAAVTRHFVQSIMF